MGRVVAVAVLAFTFLAALPVGHPLADRVSLRLAELADESFAPLSRTLNPTAHDHLMGFFTHAGYPPTIGQASRRMDDLLVVASSGAVVGLLSLSLTQPARRCARRLRGSAVG